MYVKNSDAHAFTIPGGTTGVLYLAYPRLEQSVAVVELDGVYPERGYSLNDVCTETLYVLEGTLYLTCSGAEYTLEPGDLFMILPGNKYCLTGKGKACVFITPAWDSKQNHIIEE